MGARTGVGWPLQNCGDGGEEFFRSEGFREKRHVPELLGHRFIFLQAAGRDDSNAGSDALQRADRRGTVQKRHHEVGQDDINFVLVLREEREGLGAVAGAENLVPVFYQDRPGDFLHRLFIIHEQDPFAVTQRRFGRLFHHARVVSGRDGREIDFEAVPLPTSL